MGAWGGENAPGRSRANRPSLRHPHLSANRQAGADPQMLRHQTTTGDEAASAVAPR